MTSDEEMVNQQHLAAMGLADQRLGEKVYEDRFESADRQREADLGRCPAIGQHNLRCARPEGHDGSHARGKETWASSEGLQGPTPTKQRPGDQDLPSGGLECIQDVVIAEMQRSKKVGLERYGSVLMTFNGRKGFQDLVEEARDFFVYGSMLMREADASRSDLIEVVSQALVDAKHDDLAAEAVVDRLMGWVTGRLAGRLTSGQQIYDVLHDAWPRSYGSRSEIIECQAHALMDWLGIEPE